MLEIGDPKWPAAALGLGPERRDLHMDQRILAPYIAAYKYKAFLGLTSNENGYLIEPVLLTPEGNLKHSFNFGGLMGSSDLLNATEHVDSLNEWAIKNGAISKYCTLIPSLAEKQVKLLNSAGIFPEFKKNSVIIDLNDQKIRGTTRRLAGKALSDGVLIRDCEAGDLKHFIEMYEKTMDRLEAKDHWKFTPKWFEVFFRFVRPALLMAEYGGKCQAGCIIVYSQQYPVAYYYLAASEQDHHPGAAHMLIMAACEFLKSQGIRYFYLGGGTTDKEDDGLLTFKSGFSKDRLPVYVHSKSYLN